MDISFLGHSSFKVRGKNVTVVTDPYDSAMVGLKYPLHVAPTIVTISHEHDDHNAVKVLVGSPFIIRGPGEYEVQGASIVGISVFHDEVQGVKRGVNVIYRIEIDGVSIVHLGDLGHELTTSQVDSLDRVDILMIPVGGVYTIDAKKAAHVVSEVEPKIVIPMHYQVKGLNQKSFADLVGVEIFLKELGKDSVAPIPKLSVTKDKLPAEMEVVVLE